LGIGIVGWKICVGIGFVTESATVRICSGMSSPGAFHNCR
ncbi:unnamed protein product, partial [Allacma fusca]